MVGVKYKEAEKINVRIFRYNPLVDTAPIYKTYTVPWREWFTVLEILRYVHENIEPLSFDWGCRIARCGSCGVRVNGKAVLSCITFIETRDILIEPLNNLRVIRDLVVDRSELDDKLSSTNPWLIRSSPLTKVPTIPFDSYQMVEALQLCTDCILCHSSCPEVAESNLGRFAGPWIMLKVAMRYYDPRDEAKQQRLEAVIHGGISECTLCGICANVCPQSIHYGREKKILSIPSSADEAHITRFTEDPPIDHLSILRDLKEKTQSLLHDY